MNRYLVPFAIGLSAIATALALQAFRGIPRQVSAGENRLRMSVQGSGSPAVIFDTFGGANLETWNRVQARAARFTTTVSFDHGGYWGSEPGPKPRDAQQLALELRTALRQLRIAPPIVLVGYSMGGVYARVFAGRFPEDVAGIVFVDPSTEEFMEWFAGKFPEFVQISEPHRRAQDEWASQWLSMDQARNSRLPHVPMILITGAKPQDMLTRRVLPDWLEKHRNWLHQHPHARHIVTTNSGHEVVLSDPQLVVAAIREVVEEIRSKASDASETPSISMQPVSGQKQ
jgi:pimeloyl-ACP methyl ester carboxylesterase